MFGKLKVHTFTENYWFSRLCQSETPRTCQNRPKNCTQADIVYVQLCKHRTESAAYQVHKTCFLTLGLVGRSSYLYSKRKILCCWGENPWRNSNSSELTDHTWAPLNATYLFSLSLPLSCYIQADSKIHQMKCPSAHCKVPICWKTVNSAVVASHKNTRTQSWLKQKLYVHITFYTIPLLFTFHCTWHCTSAFMQCSPPESGRVESKAHMVDVLLCRFWSCCCVMPGSFFILS